MRWRIERPSLFILALWIAHHVEAAKVLSFDISRASSPLSHILERRDAASKSFTEVITNIGVGNGYTANVSVGTPPQPLILGVDTGSTDTWVLANTADICVNRTLIVEGLGCKHGTFNANGSSTVQTVVKGGFQAKYVDGTGASGDYVSDVLALGGIEVLGMQMGLAFNSTDSQGTLGLGYGE